MIRAATFDDIPVLLDLGERMHAESPRFSQLTFCRDKMTRTFQVVMGTDLGLLDVAEIDGRIVGLMLALAFEHYCSPDIVATELALYVEPEHRGSLIGLRLIKRYRQWADGIGAKHTTAGVSTGVHTEQTARLYEAAGFQRFGVLLEA